MWGMDDEIKRLRTQIALLLACCRTRLEKARWASVQGLLQNLETLRTLPPAELCGRLVQERDYLRGIIEAAPCRDPAIMTRQTL